MSNVTHDEKLIFQAALALSNPDERQTLVMRACGDDIQLRARVEALLIAHEQEDLLQVPAAEREASRQPTGATNADPAGGQIGPYKLLQNIGEGGFGVVYLAEQRAPVQRKVAIKVIKVGMDTREVIARFEAERQALALMEHPNIAKILDAGETESGRPYFVMELVRGIPVIEYCDEHGVSIPERLRLFLDICSAIQHAHQKGIIHRDVKPSNILVYSNGEQPIPKVIDFGIAKATQGRLTDKTLFTQFRQFLGTPTYMSPEQARMSGVDVDTRTDIYSLGVLLYELLTGSAPLDARALRNCEYEEVCRRIREEDAPTPSKRVSSLQQQELRTLAQTRSIDPDCFSSRLRGDLDWIVIKAMEKDRTRRYATVDALAADIKCHLNNEPVSAAPPSAVYVLKRFGKKHRRVLMMFGVIAATLVVAAFVSTWLAVLAMRSEAIARRNLYATEMATAKTAFDQMDTQRVLELLAKYIPTSNQEDLRGFEWRWLWQQCHRESFSLQPDPNGVPFQSWNHYRDMRFSPDGRWIASGANDGTVRLWDMESRKEVWQYHGGEHCNAVDFSPDGRYLLAHFYAPRTAPTLIWNLTNPTDPVEFGQCDGGVRFFKDGSTIVGDNGAEYDLSGHQVAPAYIEPLPDAQIWARTYSKDWTTLASKHRIWDAEYRKLIKRLPPHEGYAQTGPNGIAISPINRDLIVTGSAEGIRIWNRRGQFVRLLVGTGGSPIAWLNFSNDGQLLAVRYAVGAIRVFHVDTWTEVDRIPTLPGNSVVFSPARNDLLIAGGSDGVIRAYRISQNASRDMTLEHPAELLALKFSPDERILGVGMYDGSVRFWDLQSRSELFTTPPKRKIFSTRPYETSFGPDFFDFSPDGRFAAVIGPEQTVTIWNLPDNTEIDSYTCESDKGLRYNEYFAVCFAHDGKRLYGAVRGPMTLQSDPEDVGSSDSKLTGQDNMIHGSWRMYGHIDVWEWSDIDGKLRPPEEHPGQVKCLDASPDGHFLVGTQLYLRGQPIIWKLPTMERLATLDTYGGWSALFSPLGEQIAVSGDNVKIWDVDRGRESAILRHAMLVPHVSWSEDGTRLAASDITATTKLWDIKSQHVVATFRGTISAFSPMGTLLAVGGQGSKYTGDQNHVGRVILYHAPPREEIDRIRISNAADLKTRTSTGQRSSHRNP